MFARIFARDRFLNKIKKNKLLDAPLPACYDAPDMTKSYTVLFSFYFYFGADTQPHLLRAGKSAMAKEA